MTELELNGEPDPYCEYYDEESAEDSSEETNSESEEPDDGTEQTNSELDDKIEEANSESEENETWGLDTLCNVIQSTLRPTV